MGAVCPPLKPAALPGAAHVTSSTTRLTGDHRPARISSPARRRRPADLKTVEYYIRRREGCVVSRFMTPAPAAAGARLRRPPRGETLGFEWPVVDDGPPPHVFTRWTTGNPKGRRVLTPIDGVALDVRAGPSGPVCSPPPNRGASRSADVPRQRVGDPVRDLDGRRRPHPAGKYLQGEIRLRNGRGRTGNLGGGVPTSGPTSSTYASTTTADLSSLKGLMSGGLRPSRAALISRMWDRFQDRCSRAGV